MITEPHFIAMPVHNNLHLTEKAIETCLAQDIGNVRILVFNDASTDNTSRWLAKHSQDVFSVNYSHPKGVSYIWNRALEYLFDYRHMDYVLVVNNDVELRPDTYRLLINDGGWFTTGVGVGKREQAKSTNTFSRRPHPDFSCFLIRKECWRKVGKFDERMRIYASDNDYHLRMSQAGVEAVSLALPFYHVASATIKSADGDTLDRIAKTAEQDRQAFYSKWGVEVGSKEFYDLFKHGKP